MKLTITRILHISSLLLLLIWCTVAQAQSSAFTYQGKLMESGAPATGQYEMEFRLYDAIVDGVQQPQTSPVTVAYTVANNNVVSVTGGVFTVQLDFGRDAFPGADRYLQISVRHPGESSFTPLSRQQINATPYAVHSDSAATADNATDLKNQLSSAGSLNNSANPVDWTQLKNVPSSISSGGANFTAGPGLSITGQVISNTGVLAVGASGPLSSTGGQTPTITLSGVVPVNKGGTGSASQNFVDLTTNQTIAGTKTFDRIVANNLSTSGMSQVNRYDPALIATLRWDLLPRGYGDFKVGLGPKAIAFDGTNIWVANADDTFGHTVSKLRASDGILLGEYDVGSDPEGIAFDGTSIWVANSKSNNVMQIRPSDGHVLNTYAVGDGPNALAVVNGIAWVLNANAKTISRLSVKTGANLGVLVIQNRTPQQVAFDGKNVWVSSVGNSGTGVSLFSPDGASLPSPLNLPLRDARQTGDLVFDGANMWVSDSYNGVVLKVSASELKVLNAIPVPGASRLAYDGAYLWVTNPTDQVTKLRASDGANMGAVTVINPRLIGLRNFAGAIAFDGNNIWVTNYRDSSVSKR